MQLPYHQPVITNQVFRDTVLMCLYTILALRCSEDYGQNSTQHPRFRTACFTSTPLLANFTTCPSAREKFPNMLVLNPLIRQGVTVLLILTMEITFVLTLWTGFVLFTGCLPDVTATLHNTNSLSSLFVFVYKSPINFIFISLCCKTLKIIKVNIIIHLLTRHT